MLSELTRGKCYAAMPFEAQLQQTKEAFQQSLVRLPKAFCAVAPHFCEVAECLGASVFQGWSPARPTVGSRPATARRGSNRRTVNISFPFAAAACRLEVLLQEAPLKDRGTATLLSLPSALQDMLASGRAGCPHHLAAVHAAVAARLPVSCFSLESALHVAGARSAKREIPDLR